MRIQAISQMTRETATMAFCLPRLRAIRRYRAPRRVSVLAAVIADWPSAPRRYRLPLPVRPGFAVSPDCLEREGQARPRGGVPGGGECGRVGAELSDEYPGIALADPGDLIQPLGQAQQGRPFPGAAGGVAAAGQPAGRAGRRGPGDRCQLLLDLLVQERDHGRRPHRSRELRPPRPDHPVADLSRERIKRRPVLGGLLNEYERAA
jgi:hypothetical protein